MATSSNRSTPSYDALDRFDARELWKSLVRRRKIIFWFTAFLFLLTALYCLFATRRYRATGEIELPRQASDSLGLDSSLGLGDLTSEDSLLLNIDIQTQLQVLQSDSLALAAVEDLNLESSPDFKPHFNPLGVVLGLLSPKGHRDPAHAALRDRPIRRDFILKTFESNLKVIPNPGTRLISVSYLSTDPQTARAVVDHLFRGLVAMSSPAGLSPESEPYHFMDSQLADLRKKSEDLQKQLNRMQRDVGVVSLGTTDSQGHDQAYSATLDQLQQVSTALGQAESSAILKGAIYNVAKTGDPELISGLSGNLATAASPGVSTALNLIQNLRIEEIAERATLAQNEAKFGSSYPKLEETRMRVARYDTEIRDEANRIRERAKNDYTIALEAERAARTNYNRIKAEAGAANDRAVNYAIVREEAESSRKLYEDLLSRSKQAVILQGLKAPSIAVVDVPLTPGKPARPQVALLLAASLFLGLTLGSGLALAADLLDERIETAGSIEEHTQRRPMAALPELASRGSDGAEMPGLDLTALHSPRAPYSEALQALASSLALYRSSETARVLMIAGPTGGEGATSICANLAILLAKHRRRVLVVDANLRRAGVHRAFGAENGDGLSAVLEAGSSDVAGVVRVSSAQPGLSLLTAGEPSAHPSELLGSEAFERVLSTLRGQFDIILIDVPPVLVAADAGLVARHVDDTLLVVRRGQTKMEALDESIRSLEQMVPATTIRLVLNGVQRRATKGEQGYFGDER